MRGGRHACVRNGFCRWKMERATMNNFTLPSFEAPNTPFVTSCTASSSRHSRAAWGRHACLRREFHHFMMAANEARQDEHLHAPVLRGAQHFHCQVLRHVLHVLLSMLKHLKFENGGLFSPKEHARTRADTQTDCGHRYRKLPPL